MSGTMTRRGSGRGDIIRAGPDGAARDVAPPSVTITTDPSIGLYVSAITAAGVTWTGLPAAALRVVTWNPAGRTFTTWTAATFATFVQTSNGVTATIAGGITVTATYAISGDAILWSVAVVNTGSLAVYSVEWPRIKVEAPSEAVYLCIPAFNGYVLKSPHANTTPRTLSAPSMLGFLHYYDAQSKRGLYFEKRDDVGYIADFHHQGDGSSATTLYVEHFCGPNKTAGNDWTQPYEIRTKTLTTKGDGRSGYVDAALEYRSWALAQSAGSYLRPWIPSAKWWLRSNFSTRVANAKLFIAHQDPAAGAPSSSAPNWSTYRTDLQRTKAFLGSDGSDILNIIYDWHGNVFDVNVPAHTPSRTGYATHLANIVADGAIPIPYTNIPYWDTDLTSGTYNVQNFSVFGDVRQYMAKDDNQVVKVDGGNIGILDPAFGVVSAIWLVLLQNYYLEAATAPRGYYFDQMGGTTSSATFNYSTAHAGNTGNSGATSPGKRTGITSVMDAAKSLDAQACAITEQLDEATLRLEAVLSGQNTDTALGFGVMCGTGGIVYGQFTRRLDFTVQFSDPANASQGLLYAQQAIAHWLDGGILGYHNGSTGTMVPALDNATAASSHLIYTFTVMKYLYDAHSRTIDIFKGVQQRPLLDSWQLRALDGTTTLATFLSASLKHPTSVWKTDDGALYVVLVNHNTTDPFTLDFLVNDYDLDEGVTRTLYRDVGSGFASVGEFGAQVTYEDVPPLGVTVYKLV